MMLRVGGLRSSAARYGSAGAVILSAALGMRQAAAQVVPAPRPLGNSVSNPYLLPVPYDLYLRNYASQLVPPPPLQPVPLRPRPLVRSVPELTGPAHDAYRSPALLSNLQDGNWHSTNSRSFWSRFSWSELRGWTFVRSAGQGDWFYARMVPGRRAWSFARGTSDGSWTYAVPRDNGRWLALRQRASSESWEAAAFEMVVGAAANATPPQVASSLVWKPLEGSSSTALPDDVRSALKSTWLTPTEDDFKSGANRKLVHTYREPPPPPEVLREK